MPELDITASDEHVYDVTVTADDATETHHRVTVPERFLTDHGLAASQEPVLVRSSMQYLLEREPPSAIMAAFTLEDIGRHFPGYPDEIMALI
jgi:hypothetical protein